MKLRRSGRTASHWPQWQTRFTLACMLVTVALLRLSGCVAQGLPADLCNVLSPRNGPADYGHCGSASLSNAGPCGICTTGSNTAGEGFGTVWGDACRSYYLSSTTGQYVPASPCIGGEFIPSAGARPDPRVPVTGAADPCLAYTDSESCQAQPGCGFCTSPQFLDAPPPADASPLCLSGDLYGPMQPSGCPASAWTFNPCINAASCSQCAAQAATLPSYAFYSPWMGLGCGWSTTNNQCTLGTWSGPHKQGVDGVIMPAVSWIFTTVSSGFNSSSCPAATDPCAAAMSCEECANQDPALQCGWCGLSSSSGACLSGSVDGPASYQCNWLPGLLQWSPLAAGATCPAPDLYNTFVSAWTCGSPGISGPSIWCGQTLSSLTGPGACIDRSRACPAGFYYITSTTCCEGAVFWNWQLSNGGVSPGGGASGGGPVGSGGFGPGGPGGGASGGAIGTSGGTSTVTAGSGGEASGGYTSATGGNGPIASGAAAGGASGAAAAASAAALEQLFQPVSSGLTTGQTVGYCALCFVIGVLITGLLWMWCRRHKQGGLGIGSKADVRVVAGVGAAAGIGGGVEGWAQFPPGGPGALASGGYSAQPGIGPSNVLIGLLNVRPRAHSDADTTDTQV